MRVMRNEAIEAVAPHMSLDIREQHQATARSMWVITMRRLRRSKTAMVGLTIVLLLFLVAALADVLSPFSPTQTTPNSLSVPTWLNLMGTDLLGRARPEFGVADRESPFALVEVVAHRRRQVSHSVFDTRRTGDLERASSSIDIE